MFYCALLRIILVALFVVSHGNTAPRFLMDNVIVERLPNGDRFIVPPHVDCLQLPGTSKYEAQFCYCDRKTPIMQFKVNATSSGGVELGCYSNRDVCTDCTYIEYSSVQGQNNSLISYPTNLTCIQHRTFLHVYSIGKWIEVGIRDSRIAQRKITIEVQLPLKDNVHLVGTLAVIDLFCDGSQSRILTRIEGIAQHPDCIIQKCNISDNVIPSVVSEGTTTTTINPLLSNQRFFVGRFDSGDQILNVHGNGCTFLNGTVLNVDGTCFCDSTSPHFHFKSIEGNPFDAQLGCFSSTVLCPDCQKPITSIPFTNQDGGQASIMVPRGTFNDVIDQRCLYQNMGVKLYRYSHSWLWENVVIANATGSTLKVPSYHPVAKGSLLRLELKCLDNIVYKFMFKVSGNDTYITGFNIDLEYKLTPQMTPSSTGNSLTTTITPAATFTTVSTQSTTPSPIITTLISTITTSSSIFTTTTPIITTQTPIILPELKETIYVERFLDGDHIYSDIYCYFFQNASIQFGVCKCASDAPNFHFKMVDGREEYGCFSTNEICKDCVDLGISHRIGFHQISVPSLQSSNNRSNAAELCSRVDETTVGIQTTIGYLPHLEVTFDANHQTNYSHTQVDLLVPVDDGSLIDLHVHCSNGNTIKHFLKLNGTFWYTEGSTNQTIDIGNLFPTFEPPSTLKPTKTTLGTTIPKMSTHPTTSMPPIKTTSTTSTAVKSTEAKSTTTAAIPKKSTTLQTTTSIPNVSALPATSTPPRTTTDTKIQTTANLMQKNATQILTNATQVGSSASSSLKNGTKLSNTILLLFIYLFLLYS